MRAKPDFAKEKRKEMSEIDLRPDCSRCAALCCVVLPFDRSADFGFDKAGDEPCRHLAGDNRCRIHDRLAEDFAGCVRFDCHGAGQRVTQEVFAGRSWRDDPALMGRMERAFRAMRKLHDAVLLLREAGRLPLDVEREQERQGLLAMLDAGRVRDEAELAAVEGAAVFGEVRRFLAGLRAVAVRPRHR